MIPVSTGKASRWISEEKKDTSDQILYMNECAQKVWVRGHIHLPFKFWSISSQQTDNYWTKKVDEFLSEDFIEAF